MAKSIQGKWVTIRTGGGARRTQATLGDIKASLTMTEMGMLAVEFLKDTMLEYQCVHGEDDEFGKAQIEKAQAMIDEIEGFWGLHHLDDEE